MPATTVETLIYKLETEENASKTFAKVAKEILAVEKALNMMTAAVNLPLAALSAIGSAAVKAFTSMAKAGKDFLVDSIKNFANYEDILTQAARTLDLTKEEALELGEALSELAIGAMKGGIASEELARIAGVAGQLGVAKEDVLGFTQTVAQMTAAFGISAEKAAEGMAIILNVFRLSQEEMQGVGSAIAFLGNSTAATADQIIQISQKMGGVANFFGLTAEQTAAVAATLRDVGVSVNVAGSSMSQILSRIMSEHTKFAEVLGINSDTLRAQLESNDPSQALFSVLDALNQINQMGGKIEATQALKDLGLTGVRTQSSMLLLAGSVNELRENMALANQASEEGTALQDLYNKSIDTAKGRWNAFKEAISFVQKIIGGPLAEAFSKFLDEHITPVIEAFGKWLKQSPLIAKLLEEVLPAALEKLGDTTDTIAKKFLDFLFEIDRDADGSINTLIEKIKEWGSVAFNTISDVATGLASFILDIGRLIDWYQKMRRSVEDVWNTTKFFFEELGKTVQSSPLAKLLIEIEKIGSGVGFLGEQWKTFTAGVMKFSEIALSGINSVADALSSVLGSALESAQAGWSKLGDIIFGNSVLPDTIMWTEKATEALGVMNDTVDAVGNSFVEMAAKGLAQVNAAMEQTQATLTMTEGFGGMSAEDLMKLQQGSTLSASGQIGAFQAQRANQQTGMPPVNTAMPAMPQGMGGTLNANVIIDGETVGRVITPLVNDQNDQDSRRSFGNSTRRRVA
jgi:TP901 family phage tail tape measure protein